jgi:hypothetical protein
MDFGQFEMIDRPVFLQFDHPGTLQPLFQERKDAEGNVVMEKDVTTDEMKPASDPVGVNLFSVDSEPFQKRRRAILDERMAAATSGKKQTMKAADAEAEGLKTLAACIHSFVNVDFEGKELVDRSRFIAFLQKHAWAKEQIDRGIADRSLFLKASNNL